MGLVKKVWWSGQDWLGESEQVGGIVQESLKECPVLVRRA